MKAGLMLAVNPDAEREEHDYYATDPWAVYKMKDEWWRIGIGGKKIWECACGEGHLSKALEGLGYDVRSTDLIDRGYGNRLDFLTCDEPWDGDIITNPPFKLANEFVEHSMDILADGCKAAFFLKIQYLETPKRAELFKRCGLRYVVVNSERVCCAKNGEFEQYFKQRDGHYVGGTQLYAWFVFEKGWKGDVQLRWV